MPHRTAPATAKDQSPRVTAGLFMAAVAKDRAACYHVPHD